MLRIILGCGAGLVAAIAVIMIMEALGHALMGTPSAAQPGSAPLDVTAMSTVAQAFVVLGWALGAAAGAYLAVRIARRGWAALLVAGFVVFNVIAATMMIPHPLWMVVAGVVAPLAAGLLVFRLVRPQIA